MSNIDNQIDNELTPEQLANNRHHAELWLEAFKANNIDAKKYHNSQIFADPDVLMASKRAFGADFIRENNYNTTLADRKFGHGWLDR